MFLDPNFHFGLLNSKTLFNTHDYLITHTEKKPVNSLPSPFYCWLPTLLPITWKIVSYICRWIDLRLQIDYEVNGFWAVVMSAQHSEALYTCPVTVVTASCQSSLWGALEPVIRILFQGQGARKFSYAPPSYYQALKELALYFHEKEKKKDFFPHYFFNLLHSSHPCFTTTKLWGGELAFHWLICVFSPTLELRRNTISEK